MPGPAVPQVHYGVLLPLIEAVRIHAFFRIIFAGRIMIEIYLSFPEAVPVRNVFIEIVIRIVYCKRRCSRKIAVCPGIRKYVHRKTRRLQIPAFCEIYGIPQQFPVRIADEPVFAQESPAALLINVRIQVTRKEMERCPYPCNVLKPHRVSRSIHKLQLELCRGS